jgi:hypothetical protein
MKWIVLLLCLIGGNAFAADPSDPGDITIGKPADISQELFAIIRKHCADYFPTDFNLRDYCERREFQAVRALRGETDRGTIR